jgi:hypothetical protein
MTAVPQPASDASTPAALAHRLPNATPAAPSISAASSAPPLFASAPTGTTTLEWRPARPAIPLASGVMEAHLPAAPPAMQPHSDSFPRPPASAGSVISKLHQQSNCALPVSTPASHALAHQLPAQAAMPL